MAYGVNAPTGFSAMYTITGAPFVLAQNIVLKLNPAGTTPLGAGDCVTFGTDGYVTVATAGDSNVVLGVFSGAEYKSSTTPVWQYQFQNYWPASGVNTLANPDVDAKVYVDPTIIYSVQANSAVSGGYTFSNVGNTASFVAGTPSATSPYSTQSLGAAGTSANSQFKIVGLDNTVASNAWGVAYNNVLVTSNWSFFTPRSAGI
jgi:hypothetical protein